jgi:hypothetical protein
MNFFVKIAAVVFRTFDNKGAHSPYFDTILTIYLISFFHTVHIGLLFNISSNYIMPWSTDSSKSMQWLFGSIYVAIFSIVISMIFKKSKLEKVNVSNSQIDRCRTILPIYYAICIILLAVLLIKKGVEQGKINI